MSAFEDINGVSATANKYWSTDILRDKLDFSCCITIEEYHSCDVNMPSDLT